MDFDELAEKLQNNFGQAGYGEALYVDYSSGNDDDKLTGAELKKHYESAIKFGEGANFKDEKSFLKDLASSVFIHITTAAAYAVVKKKVDAGEISSFYDVDYRKSIGDDFWYNGIDAENFNYGITRRN